ncbi:MAG: response regulator transcription factor [Burkholderiales bacterium]|nr:response regulator transcription factor [Burkholderiales bacterium]
MTAQGHNAIRVLLVDDHRSVVWGLERLIESARPGMEVVGSAANCADALALLEAKAPDVVLLDMDLGSESGLAAIPQFLAAGKARILVLTGVREQSVRDAAVLAGARGVVHKEAPAETILEAIRKVHEGQLWLDRETTARLFTTLTRQGAERPLDPEQQKIDSLTAKERAVVAAIANDPGATAKTVADGLHVSEHTLRNHLTSIYSKLGVANRLELFAYAQRHGLNRLPGQPDPAVVPRASSLKL